MRESAVEMCVLKRLESASKCRDGHVSELNEINDFLWFGKRVSLGVFRGQKNFFFSIFGILHLKFKNFAMVFQVFRVSPRSEGPLGHMIGHH